MKALFVAGGGMHSLDVIANQLRGAEAPPFDRPDDARLAHVKKGTKKILSHYSRNVVSEVECLRLLDDLWEDWGGYPRPQIALELVEMLPQDLRQRLLRKPQ